MGWCSGTVVFDAVCDALLGEDKEVDKKYALRALIDVLHDEDWDCESESEYFNHPLVKEAFCDLGFKDFYEGEEN